MCLSVAVERPDDVLARGKHLDYEWMIVHNRMGYRCGYVRVPVGHPWHGKHYDELEGVEVHGGLTFSEPDKQCDKPGPDDAHWLGFDCAHGGDAPDSNLPADSGGAYSSYFSRYGTVRTQEYVEAECRSLCEQAAEAAKN